ncbi:MAG: hypothetical protein WC740_14630 [Verrucomicrobiia bacterium]
MSFIAVIDIGMGQAILVLIAIVLFCGVKLLRGFMRRLSDGRTADWERYFRTLFLGSIIVIVCLFLFLTFAAR